MPTRLIKFGAGGIYHVYNRGNNKKQVFPDSDHYASCERLMRNYSQRYQIRILAYVLMPNHYHFLVQQQSDIPVSRWIYSIFQAYARHLNQLESYSGNVFEGRYHCKQVQNETYLIRSVLYIHGNPVKDGLVNTPEDWPYSNYLAWSGLHPDKPCLKLFGSAENYQDAMHIYLENIPKDRLEDKTDESYTEQ